MHVLYILVLYALLLLPSGAFRFEWRLGDKKTCDARRCEEVNNTDSNSLLCSHNSGVKIPFGARDPISDLFSNISCTYAEVLDNDYHDSSALINALGDNAVIAFVGDSIIRNLLHSFLDYLGPMYKSWYTGLQAQSKNWDGAYRDKMDHAYLCSPPLGPRNLTISFFWRNYLGYSVSRVPFVSASMPGKFGKCVWWENGDAMKHCDSATDAGRAERWQCSDTLDNIQLPGKPKRAFVVIASGGAHTAVEEVMHRDSTNATQYLQVSKSRWEAAWDSMELTKAHWKVISEQGGRNIFLQPLKMQNGWPRTTAGNHHSVIAMNHMLDFYFKSRLRSRVNLTCENGLEVIETDSATVGPNAPGGEGDGIHYGDLTNYVIIQLIAERLLKFNSSTWRNDSVSWNQTTSHLDNSC